MSAFEHWELHPAVAAPLLLSAAMYAAGVARLWSRTHGRRGLPTLSVAAFAAGWLVAAAALVSPIAWLSGILFSVHMTQHTLLMLIAAPLMAFGRPLFAFLWAFPAARRERISTAFRGARFLRLWRSATAPLAAFLIQAAALWMWHLPVLYQAALADESVHAVQHLSFVAAASLFWWAMVHGRYGRQGYGLAVVYVFLTAIHSGALGALLTVAPSPWYSYYVSQGAAWRVDPLGDQQLAGLLMWIPAGVVFIVLGLALFAAWMGEAERRVRLGATDAASRTLLVLLAAAAFSSACGADFTHEAETLTGGSVHQGKTAIGKYGCAGCHTIPGIDRARATVGPPLTAIAQRHYLGGHLVNTPDNMIKWIQYPQRADPGNAMPNLGVTDQDARDIAAYLYTLR
ncbi:MAG TPA: cytochrome c oxidase assembly protein [Vicinamibacterales bacterium]|nr:cytochrome c oxidase assembly protein [Vicinamibacterales bacterium]